MYVLTLIKQNIYETGKCLKYGSSYREKGITE